MKTKLIIVLVALVVCCPHVDADNKSPTMTNPTKTPAVTKSILEDTPIGTSIYQCSATDPDDKTTANGTLSFNFKSGNQERRFSMDAASCTIYVARILEYDVTKSYKLNLQVTDGAGSSDSEELTITINDTNNNAPSCSPSLVWGSLFENATVYSAFATINCSDRDTGPGKMLDFNIQLGNSPTSRSDTIGASSVNNSGYIIRAVDYEVGPHSYTSLVLVSDQGTPPMQSNFTLILSVKDCDDNAPVISPVSTTTSIEEHSGLGTSVLKVMATDADAPDTPASQITFESTCTPDVLTIDRYSGDVVVKDDIDYEKSPEINCQVSAYSDVKNKTKVNFKVIVKNKNDGIPVFAKPFYIKAVDENAPVDQTIINVVATDPENDKITYTIDPNVDFDITSNGAVTIKQSPDYETTTSYLVTITAVDNGSPPLTSTTLLQVIINPLNEFAPEFDTTKPCAGSVPEDAIYGTSVTITTATDADHGLDGVISYSIITPNVPFFIDKSTGFIGVNSKLDFETVTSYTITVKAMDNSNTSPKWTTETCLITVTDVNDQSVQCAAPNIVIIKYPFNLAAPVTTVNCSLPGKTVQLTYALTGGDDGSFQVDSATGALTLNNIPYSQQYYLKISATYGADTADTTIIVLSERQLNLTNLPQTIHVPEGQPGRNLITVQACCAFPEIKFSILNGNNDTRATLTGSNGNLASMMTYDREFQSIYEYVIGVTSTSGQSASGTVTVTVDDINDNAPVFAPDFVETNVAATLAIGSGVTPLTASDKDFGINAEFDFHIAQGDSGQTFSIDPQNGDISLAKALDYDTTNTYVLIVTATDKGSPPLTGSITVVVNVVDNRNLTPQIIPTGGPFAATLSEDSALGTTVFQLQAKATNSKCVYDIVSGNTNDVFQIDNKNGSILIVKQLDRETINFYSLNLSATDQNGRAAFGSVNINITDVNDNRPVPSQGVFVFNIPDQTATNYDVGLLNVTDPDLGPNGTVILTILQGNTAGAFILNGLHLFTNIQVNYPVVNVYRLVVKATDMGTPTKSSTFIAIVYILNSNIPFFNISSDTISVLENATVESQIYDANATGKGAKEDGSLTYSIDSGNPNVKNFGIRDKSGQVVIVEALDFETMPETINLVITARNTAQPGLSATFILTVTILDVNEYAPMFYQLSLSFQVNEDVKPKYPVGTVLAVDYDKKPAGEITETWSGSTDFSINYQTGVITSNAILDYRARQYYRYILTAQDHGVPILRTNASIVINIVDVNDNSPVFYGTLDVEVPDSVPVGCEIFQVHAYDLDTGPDGNVSFEIVNPSSEFFINQFTGIVQTQVRLDGITTPEHLVTIRAFDAGNPVLDNTTTLKIHVVPTNPNYFDPVFPASSATSCPVGVTVPRNSPRGYVVTSCAATDKDTGDSGKVEHMIISGNQDGYFLIDTVSGDVTTATNLLTAKNNYNIGILATDGGKPQRNASRTLGITILPEITSNVMVNYTFSVAEDATVGSEVGLIVVKDGRTVSSYNIQSGNYGDDFNIDLVGDDGSLKIHNNLDREVYSLYSLVVQVINDVDVLTIVVEVGVTDVNDNRPTFPYTSLSLDIAENSPIGTLVKIVSCSDLDTDAVNKNNTISIVPPQPLSIDQSGNLRVSSSLDFETIQHYDVMVFATENQPPYTTSSLSITLNVIDVEEKELVSTSDVTESALISLEVPHQASVGFFVYTLKPGDFGLTPSQAAVTEFVVYKRISPFSIHASTGDITVNGQLSYHTKYFLWALIKVRDGGAVTNRTSLIRIDTFDRASEMIVIEFADSYSYVQNNLLRFRHRAQEFFSQNNRIGFCSLQDTSTGSRRRLLAQKAAVYTYVVNNTVTDQMSNINEPKTFMSKQQILNVLQSSRDGSPVIGLSDPSVVDVATVEPFEEKSTSDSFEDFISSPAGIAVFCLLALLVLVILVLILTCIFYRKYRGKWGKQSEKKKDKERPKNKSFSKMLESPTFFSGSPQIIVSAPPPVTQHDPAQTQLDQTEDTINNNNNNNIIPQQKNKQISPINKQENTVNNTPSDTLNNLKDPIVLNGLPSQYKNKSSEKNNKVRKEKN